MLGSGQHTARQHATCGQPNQVTPGCAAQKGRVLRGQGHCWQGVVGGRWLWGLLLALAWGCACRLQARQPAPTPLTKVPQAHQAMRNRLQPGGCAGWSCQCFWGGRASRRTLCHVQPFCVGEVVLPAAPKAHLGCVLKSWLPPVAGVRCGKAGAMACVLPWPRQVIIKTLVAAVLAQYRGSLLEGACLRVGP